MIRNIIPSKIRIIVQLTVVAALVIIVDQVLKAFSYELSNKDRQKSKLFCLL